MFEVTSEGTRDIRWEPQDAQLALHLGTLQLTRLILITTDPGLRSRLHSRYDQSFAANVQPLQ